MTEPMGNSGVQVDFETGRPAGLSADAERERQARGRALETQGRLLQLRTELGQDGGAVLRLLEEAMLTRAEQVLARDEPYQALAGFAETLGLELKVLPRLVRRQLTRLVGEDFYNLTRMTEAAPEGIPAQE